MNKIGKPATKIPEGWIINTQVNILPDIVSTKENLVLEYRYVQEVEGIITLQETDSSEPKVIGGFAFDLILGELLLKEGLMELFDAYDLEQYYCDFFEEMLDDDLGNYKRSAQKAFGITSSSKSPKNVMLLLRMALLPEYRKIGLGRLIMNDILTRYSMGAGVVAVEPSPFSFTQDNIINENIPWDDAGWADGWGEWLPAANHPLHAPLGKYFEEFGFKPVTGSRYMLARL